MLPEAPALHTSSLLPVYPWFWSRDMTHLSSVWGAAVIMGDLEDKAKKRAVLSAVDARFGMGASAGHNFGW